MFPVQTGNYWSGRQDLTGNRVGGATRQDHLTPRAVETTTCNTSQQATTTTSAAVATDYRLRMTELLRVIATGNATRALSKQAAKPDLANNRERLRVCAAGPEIRHVDFLR